MPFRICKTIEIENGHQLSKHPDKCRFPHGHSRRVEFILEADALDQNGMVCDFKLIRDAIGGWLDQFDHALCLNTADPMFATLKAAYGERIIAFQDTDPTTEILARTFFENASALLAAHSEKANQRFALGSHVRLRRVRVWETSSTWAEFES
ncbi:MAG: 6-carboxytetrahydropterin synthase [Verrucomicrobiales bacterium]|nr:6-carboxytetrahydropterin synthase [Verrucomicrobiales bacterium]